MVRTRAQSTAQKGRKSPGPRIGESTLKATERTEREEPSSSALLGSTSQRITIEPAPDTRGIKRRIDKEESEVGSTPQRQRRRDTCSFIKPLDPIRFWAKEGTWPPEVSEMGFEQILYRKERPFSRGSKRSYSKTSSQSESRTSYQDAHYRSLLAAKGSFMDDSNVGISEQSKEQCLDLLNSTQPIPPNSLFRDDLFNRVCKRARDELEATVIRDITPLIVPSVAVLSDYGERHLDILKESVDRGWNNSITVAGTRPQPDYAVGFAREAFSDEQFTKLSPFIGDVTIGDQSFFMATQEMYFPFLTCEVKAGCSGLDVADFQNAHSATVAVRGIVQLFRALNREGEVHREILAFSISHDCRYVRIYGHYPVIDGNDTQYYRHPIREFCFTDMDGRERWAAYRFTKNVYDRWMPSHLEKICSAIDQLRTDLNFDDPSLAAQG